jgi:Reverse transcriptase (RNA-dependent DNA polymerase)
MLITIKYRGLRQGCPLSPYLFIIAMKFLTKGINKVQQEGGIELIQLVDNAPTLTHAIYADDLVLFGKASAREVNIVQGVLGEFGACSGLKVKPDKSKIWFSKVCGEGREITGRWRVGKRNTWGFM